MNPPPRKSFLINFFKKDRYLGRLAFPKHKGIKYAVSTALKNVPRDIRAGFRKGTHSFTVKTTD